MGITYEQLGVFGRLRKVARGGPVATFHAAVRLWHTTLPIANIAERVKFFFRCACTIPVLVCMQHVHLIMVPVTQVRRFRLCFCAAAQPCSWLAQRQKSEPKTILRVFWSCSAWCTRL